MIIARRVSTTIGWIAVFTLTAAVARGEPRSLNDMTGNWQLLVDDHLISTTEQIQRVWHPFRKHAGNPILKPDKPWEYNTVKLSMVLPDEERTGFRMWYSCGSPKNDPDRGHSSLATSKDGVVWEKPNLGLLPWRVNDSMENNFVSMNGAVVHSPWNPPESRYTSIAFGSYTGATSPDGLRRGQTSEQLTSGGDVGRFHWDPHTRRYRGYVKVSRKVRGLSRRSVGFSESTSILERWPDLRLVLAPDDEDDSWVTEEGSISRTHFYGMTPFSYETMYFAFLWIFRADDDEGYFYGPLYTELVSSRDGIHWRRQDAPRIPMIELSPPGAWDDGMIIGGALVVDGDELKAYYTGYDDTHDIVPMHSCIGLATMRKDGFASMDAGAEAGKLVTKRIAGATGPLHVNCDASNGWLRVAIVDENDNVIPGYGKDDCHFLRGGSVDKIVTWNEHDELPTGYNSLRLVFMMQNASLYSFMAGEKMQVIEDEPAPTLAALYTLEDGTLGRRKAIIMADQLPADGVQGTTFFGTTNLGIKLNTEPEHAAFGEKSLHFMASFTPRSTMEIAGTSKLGRKFTLAVMAKSTEKRHARLFSSYDDFGGCKTAELVFDCDPTGNAVAGLRLIAQGMSVESRKLNFADGKYHHLAVVYDEGEVTFYLDGEEAGKDWVTGGTPVDMERNLLVGEDAKHGQEQQFRGYLDDILVLGRAMSAAEIKTLSQQGAETFFKDHQDNP